MQTTRGRKDTRPVLARGVGAERGGSAIAPPARIKETGRSAS